MRKEGVKRIEVFKTWIWRRIDREDQLDRTQNERISIEKGGKRSLMEIIRTRQKNWIGHILRGDSMQKEIMDGRMEGKRGRGRPRQKLMEDGYGKLVERAQHREDLDGLDGSLSMYH